MWIIILALCLLGMFTAIFGYIQQRLHEKAVREGKAVEEPEAPLIEEEECCGEHSTCEKDSLLAAVSKDIEYYDDEDLDRFVALDPATYTEDDVEEFREIFYTLQEVDIAGWVRSLQLRQIELPYVIKEEVLLVMRESREHH